MEENSINKCIKCIYVLLAQDEKYKKIVWNENHSMEEDEIPVEERDLYNEYVYAYCELKTNEERFAVWNHFLNSPNFNQEYLQRFNEGDPFPPG